MVFAAAKPIYTQMRQVLAAYSNFSEELQNLIKAKKLQEKCLNLYVTHIRMYFGILREFFLANKCLNSDKLTLV